MHIIFSFDYELFFGANSGSVEKCILEPAEKLRHLAGKYGVKLNLFVDTGFLTKLKQEQTRFEALQNTYNKVCSQLNAMAREGHDLQLHIHPHWEDSYYDGNRWIMDTSRYRLHQFEEHDITRLISEQKQLLEEISEKQVFAYRAGGWCIQPFDKLRKPLLENGIWMDSTVFYGGQQLSGTQYFDFTSAPDKTSWRFSNDPCREDPDGAFYEIPITSCRVSPMFFWKLAYTKLKGGSKHKAFGDGQPVSHASSELFKKLFQPTRSVVSVDGYKASFLKKAFLRHQKRYESTGNFVVIGHPKAITPYSLQKMEQFFRETSGYHSFETYTSLASQHIY